MKTALALALAALPLAACGPQTEEDLISDDEVSAIISSRDGLVTTQPPAAESTVVHVRVAWGYFAGKFRDLPGWVNWSGGARMEGGQVSIENLVYFDRHDHPVATQEADAVAWSSKTLPHFDGAVLQVASSAPGQSLHFVTPRFERSLTIEELSAGVNLHETIDSDGHEVAITSVPDQGCAGFSYGYEKPSSEGWLGFAGLFTDQRGTITGRLRLRAEGDQLKARLWKSDGSHPYDLSVSGDPSATGEGTIDLATHRYAFALTDASGTTVARIQGLYADPSYSPRGSYEAVVSCP
jgi:hypothetical protein